MTMRAQDNKTRAKGQVMVLSCVTMLVLALMIFAGFTMSNAVHERIRLQSQADATAYSAAVVAARAMNVTTYTNRAIAAVLVEQMSVHAWMAIASETAFIHLAGAVNFGQMAACEMDSSHCCSIRCYGVCCNVPHCIHSLLDGIIAMMHMIQFMDYNGRVQGKESDFNDAVEALNAATIDLHQIQTDALSKAKTQISSESSLLSKLKSVNAPKSSYKTQVLSKNGGEFACALEGTDFDGDCAKVSGSNPSKSDAAKRSKIMGSAANAAREMFHVGCGNCTKSGHDDFQSGSDHLMDVQWNDDEEKHSFSLTAGMSANPPIPAMGPAEAKSVGALTTGTMSNKKFCEECGKSFALFTTAWSNENGGMHILSHSGNHDKFKGYQQEDVCGDKACFVNFRANSDADIDFNQPSMYASVTQDIGERRAQKRGAWELNENSTVKVEIGGDVGTTNFVLKPRHTGGAVAKAKVYYHDFNGWQNQPNMFDPFWRAKLHPFKRAEMQAVLDGEAQSTAGSAPVEGDTEGN